MIKRIFFSGKENDMYHSKNLNMFYWESIGNLSKELWESFWEKCGGESPQYHTRIHFGTKYSHAAFTEEASKVGL